MFKKNDANRIYKSVNFAKSGLHQEGELIDSWFNEAEQIPLLEEIAEESMNNLRKEGFRVRRVKPQTANCIIRIFRHEDYKCGDDRHWLYGAEAFVRSYKGMKSERDTIINYSKSEITIWLFQDEYVDIKPHFVDYYVRIF